MEVLPKRPFQFKQVVLYLPGHERDDKQWKGLEAAPLFKKEPELWKTYRRLSAALPNEKPNEKHVEGKFNCQFVPPTVEYPDRAGMKCMCYENLMQIIKERVNIPPPRIYRVQKEHVPKIRLEGTRPSWTRKAMQGFYSNQQLQYPLTTIIVRWQLKRKLPKYDPETLKSIFAQYGEIKAVRILSPNSCLIIFKDISTACRVIQARCLGDPMNKLTCTWWHKSMANKCVAARAKGVSIKTDVFIV